MRQGTVLFSLVVFIALGACSLKPPTQPASNSKPEQKPTLSEARRGFKTRLIKTETDSELVVVPPKALFQIVYYQSPIGKLAAYVSQPPPDKQKRPAMIWLTGGFSNSIDNTPWAPATPDNDQSASAFRQAGMILMFPSLRGGNLNPGYKEAFYGEVDDVLAAIEYLSKQEFVDPNRIYLGGHSTGGTLALLVAASTDRLRAVFSFGPVEDVWGYGPDNLPFDTTNDRELDLRAPKLWLHSIKTPTFVFEGTVGNWESLQELSRSSQNPVMRFHSVIGADHFNILSPVTQVIATKIKLDTSPIVNLEFQDKELNDLFIIK
ncbi:MAG: prolyl oligopeptidase family serine peptidase [Acidobacteria bacterium]|nr:prolyl oligopeptidase family serine peptidase [Acidobacteriota bacterium]